jgi:hypothetical protein
MNKKYWLLALINYGLILTKDQIEQYKFEPLKKMLLSTKMDSWINSKYGPGQKHLIFNNEFCPISCNKIIEPAFLIDGTLFEYSEIKKYLKKNDINPLTREKLFRPTTTFYKDTDGEFISKKASGKIIYCPDKNRFVYL